MSTPLKQFLAVLATDPETLGEYLRNPDELLTEAGLSPEDIAILKCGDPSALLAQLEAEGSTGSEASTTRPLANSSGYLPVIGVVPVLALIPFPSLGAYAPLPSSATTPERGSISSTPQPPQPPIIDPRLPMPIHTHLMQTIRSFQRPFGPKPTDPKTEPRGETSQDVRSPIH